ncbi:MAG: ShlB/FhaC/HecB family hemolysin secretion/activation protein [Limnohabitans sp.]
MHSTKKRLLLHVFDVGFSAAWRLLPAGMLLASLAHAQSTNDLSANRETSGVVFPNADWIRFPALTRKTAPVAAVPPPEPATPGNTTNTIANDNNRSEKRPANQTAAPVNSNDWVQFPRLPPPAAKPSPAAPAPKPAPEPVVEPAASAKPPDAPAANSETTAQPPDSSDEFTFKQFRFQGNTVYSDSDLEKLLRGKVPAVKTLPDIQRAAEAVAALYQEDGVLARVDLLPQDLTDGLVTITITEGRFAGARMESADSPKLAKDFLVKLVETAQPKNAPVKLSQMDKATMLLNEVPGVQASVRLSTGQEQGETIALVQVQDKRPWDGQITVDNTGSISTGNYRFSSQYSRYGGLGRGDISSIQYLHSAGLDYARLGYSEPLGYGGARFGANTEWTRYTVVDPTYDALDLHGPATTINGFVSQPLVRHRQFSSDLVLSGDHKKYTNHSKFSTTRYQLDSLSASVQINSQDQWMGGGENSANLQLTRGLIDYETDKSDGTEGLFTKWRLSINRKQKVDAAQMLLLSYQRQRASRNLDSSEKFGIGGSSAVRAYPAGEASGTQANLFSIELQRDFQWNKQAYKFSSFYDVGEVDKEKHATSTGLNSYKLQGIGLWLGASYPNAWGQSQWRVTWARRLGSNPGASNGNDSDGTYYLNRFWLSASQMF